MQRLASIGAIGASIPSALFLVILWFGQDYMYLLFGTASQTTIYCALILSFGQVFCAFVGYASQSLAMSGHEAKVARVTMGCFLSALMLVPLSAHFYGILGTAICMTGLTLIREILLWGHCVKTLGIYSDCISAVFLMLGRLRKQRAK